MTWRYQLTQVEGRTAGLLLEDHFAVSAPTESLQRLTWFAVHCRHDPVTSFWHPEETDTLDSIEGDLLRLCDEFAHGWAVYVRRLDTRGIREYFHYSGGSAELERVLPLLQALHPDYRLEYDSIPDPEWHHYHTWLRQLGGMRYLQLSLAKWWKRVIAGS